MIQFWYETLKWGYGYFHCSAGEHLNKQMKQIERYDTNSQTDRFIHVIRKIRLRQFHFNSMIFKAETTVKCSRCHQIGHNRKNKSCQLHPDQPQLPFPESEED